MDLRMREVRHHGGNRHVCNPISYVTGFAPSGSQGFVNKRVFKERVAQIYAKTRATEKASARVFDNRL